MIEKKWTRRVVNNHVGRVARMFKWACSQELVPPSVFHGLLSVEGLRKGRSEAKETQPIRPVPDAFVAAVERWVSPSVWAMIQLQLLTGCRPGEVIIMRPATWTRPRPSGLTSPSGTRPSTMAMFARCTSAPSTRGDRTVPSAGSGRVPVRPRGIRAVAPRRDVNARRKTPLAQGNSPGTVAQTRRPQSARGTLHRRQLPPRIPARVTKPTSGQRVDG